MEYGPVTVDAFSSTKFAFNGGLSIPAGTYDIIYVRGAMRYDNLSPTSGGRVGPWLISTGPAEGSNNDMVRFEYYLNGVLTNYHAPADFTYYVSQAALEAALSYKISVRFVHSGGVIKVWVRQTNTGDNTAGNPNPTFILRRVA